MKKIITSIIIVIFIFNANKNYTMDAPYDPTDDKILTEAIRGATLAAGIASDDESIHQKAEAKFIENRSPEEIRKDVEHEYYYDDDDNETEENIPDPQRIRDAALIEEEKHREQEEEKHILFHFLDQLRLLELERSVQWIKQKSKEIRALSIEEKRKTLNTTTIIINDNPGIQSVDAFEIALQTMLDYDDKNPENVSFQTLLTHKIDQYHESERNINLEFHNRLTELQSQDSKFFNEQSMRTIKSFDTATKKVILTCIDNIMEKDPLANQEDILKVALRCAIKDYQNHTIFRQTAQNSILQQYYQPIRDFQYHFDIFLRSEMPSGVRQLSLPTQQVFTRDSKVAILDGMKTVKQSLPYIKNNQEAFLIAFKPLLIKPFPSHVSYSDALSDVIEQERQQLQFNVDEKASTTRPIAIIDQPQPVIIHQKNSQEIAHDIVELMSEQCIKPYQLKTDTLQKTLGRSLIAIEIDKKDRITQQLKNTLKEALLKIINKTIEKNDGFTKHQILDGIITDVETINSDAANMIREYKQSLYK